MSDYIPFNIQVQIIKKLPAKSLAQFRSVSKRWKSLIDSSEFIAAYSSPQTYPQHLACYDEWCGLAAKTWEKCVSLVDDETFALQEVVPDVPVLVKQLHKSRVVGSSHGLWCFCDIYHASLGNNTRTTMAVLWNPCIRKSVGIAVPSELSFGFETVLGFGVCPITNDPTIVKFTSGRSVVPFVAEIFTLSTGIWRVASTSTLPQKPIVVTWCQVVLDRFIYWLAFDTMAAGGELILSFDMTTQEFSVLVDLPFSCEQPFCNGVAISKVFDSLAVIVYIDDFPEEQSCDVYMVMDRGNPHSFTLLYTVYTPYQSINVLSFSKKGKPIIETKDDYKQPAALVVYEPASESCKDIGVYGESFSFFVGTYMETLLLIDQLDSRVYPISTEDGDGHEI